jgi:hypothetical protein
MHKYVIHIQIQLLNDCCYLTSFLRIVSVAVLSSRKLLWLDVPVLLRVVLDRTVRAELAHLYVVMISHVYCYRIEPFVQREMAQITNLGGGTDALLDPLRAVFVRLVDHGEGRDVCRSCQNHEWRGLSSSEYSQESKSSPSR